MYALAIGLALLSAAPTTAANDATRRPNIVLIYSDDVGYGDLGCYGAMRIKTPNLDRLAHEGLRHTDGHSGSATCTPSRFAMMTGEYAWRQKGTGILPGDAALIIEPGRPTFASVLKAAGYTTGVVGKWHLGLGRGGIDWNGPIAPGPLEIGFDRAFLIPATGDRVPCVYVDNHKIAGYDPRDPIQVSYDGPIGDDPTGKDHPELLKMKPSHGHDMTIVNGISRIGYMSGGKAARWVDEDMADTITKQAVAFIEANQSRPFFLYFATHDIHVPRVPHPRFVGSSPGGPRSDAMQEADWSVGEVLKTLDRLGLAENTLVIYTSDNGPVVDDGYQDDAVAKLGDHRPAGPWRGGKSSNFEGGTRVPMLVRWPGQVAAGSTSDALIGQVDFLRSFAAIAGATVPEGASPDGQDQHAALLGESKTGRESLVEHARVLSLRQGSWKLISPSKGPARAAYTNTELGNAPDAQLYNLADDPGETKDLAATHPDRVAAMKAELDRIRSAGRLP